MIKKPWALVALILVLGAGLRFHALDRQSLWDDEMSTLKDLSLPLASWPARFSSYEMHPPLFFLQLRGWEVAAGSSLSALRANSAFWGSVALILMFLLGSLYGGGTAGLLAMTLLAFSPYHLAYSQELRPYAFSIAFALSALLALEYALAAPQRRFPWILLAGFWTLQLYAHYWGSFVVAAQGLYGLFQAKERRTRLAVFLSGVAAGGLFCFWLPILHEQMKQISALSFWVPSASAANLVKPFFAFSGIYFPVASSVFTLSGPFILKAILGGLFLWALVRSFFQGPRAAKFWLLLGLGLPFLLSYRWWGLFVWYRYPSLIYPAFVLLVAAGVMSICSPRLRWMYIVLLLVGEGWGAWIYSTRWQKANPKAVVAYVHSLETAQTQVIRPAYFAPLFTFYDHGASKVWDEHLLDSDDKRMALKGKPLIFISFDTPRDEIRDALLSQFTATSQRYFPGFAHLGITVYELK